MQIIGNEILGICLLYFYKVLLWVSKRYESMLKLWKLFQAKKLFGMMKITSNTHRTGFIYD